MCTLIKSAQKYNKNTYDAYYLVSILEQEVEEAVLFVIPLLQFTSQYLYYLVTK